MSQSTFSAQPGQPSGGLFARLRTGMADNPTLVLIGVLVLLFLLTGWIEPNFLSVGGIRNTLLQAAPLGILAGAQTILMLSGGIDLSAQSMASDTLALEIDVGDPQMAARMQPPADSVVPSLA